MNWSITNKPGKKSAIAKQIATKEILIYDTTEAVITVKIVTWMITF